MADFAECIEYLCPTTGQRARVVVAGPKRGVRLFCPACKEQHVYEQCRALCNNLQKQKADIAELDRMFALKI
jgi:hypothetical protein